MKEREEKYDVGLSKSWESYVGVHVYTVIQMKDDTKGQQCVLHIITDWKIHYIGLCGLGHEFFEGSP